MEETTSSEQPGFSGLKARPNPPAIDFAPPQYVMAQLRSDPPAHIPPIARVALPHVPQFGSHFGLGLVTRERVEACETHAVNTSGAVCRIPLLREWPPRQAESPAVALQHSTYTPWLFGYYVINGEDLPIVKSISRPEEEWLLASRRINMPIRFARYSMGKLEPWIYTFKERRELVETG